MPSTYTLSILLYCFLKVVALGKELLSGTFLARYLLHQRGGQRFIQQKMERKFAVNWRLLLFMIVMESIQGAERYFTTSPSASVRKTN